MTRVPQESSAQPSPERALTPPAPGIEVTGLTRSFGSVVALQPLSLTIHSGQITGLLGPNGSGKSTFLRLLVGLTPPDSGGARVAGVALTGDGAAIRRRATYLPGEIGVYGEFTGREHLAWLLRGRKHAARRQACSLADELGLPLERRVHGYSHGMKRQLLLAAALAPRVPVRILDEPTEGLDPTKRAHVLELLRRDVRAHGTTILFSSHHLGEVEQGCERILFLHRGRLVDEAEAQTVRDGARRMLKITWEEGAGAPSPENLHTALESIGVTDVRLEGTQATLLLPADDPREALGALLANPDLPAPASLQFGTLSLRELYRVLYGTEGV